MTLIDAIKSGKPFRKPGWDSWLYVTNDRFVWDYGADAMYDFRPSWVTDTDWEIQETYYPITEEEIHQLIESGRREGENPPQVIAGYSAEEKLRWEIRDLIKSRGSVTQ